MVNNDILIKEKWNRASYKEFIKYLMSLGNKSLVEFNSRIVNTKQVIIGIKTPFLRDIAKVIAKGDMESFLSLVEDKYFEETLIKGFVIGYIKDKKLFLKHFNDFILNVDNWATCDTCVSSFKIMKMENFYDLAKSLSFKNDEFVARVGLIIILDYYVDEEHIKDILSLISNIHSDYYYVNMAISWLISVCFVKFRTNTLELIKRKNLPVFVQNKAISKIRDSYRVTDEDKELVKKYLIN